MCIHISKGKACRWVASGVRVKVDDENGDGAVWVLMTEAQYRALQPGFWKRGANEKDEA
jgi:hypothetical protein